jgi:hypothetical protein
MILRSTLLCRIIQKVALGNDASLMVGAEGKVSP